MFNGTRLVRLLPLAAAAIALMVLGSDRLEHLSSWQRFALVGGVAAAFALSFALGRSSANAAPNQLQNTALVAAYHALVKFVRWYGRLVTSAVAGLLAALVVCLIGGRMIGPHYRDEVTAILIVLALPVWILVSVISYRFLKPDEQ